MDIPASIKHKSSNDPRARAMQNAAVKAAATQEEQKKQNQVQTDITQPGTTKATKRTDVFSPGISSIKEILDITYAVQRMGEEKKMRTPVGHTNRTLGGRRRRRGRR
ncbi:Putative CAMK/CAMK1/CAMK1-RCK protein kinase [Rhizopus microsporus]|nr:Putative CAMK/CAMK1/CAMK1-RCK protein kinase [Rhizopus microsporus]